MQIKYKSSHTPRVPPPQQRSYTFNQKKEISETNLLKVIMMDDAITKEAYQNIQHTHKPSLSWPRLYPLSSTITTKHIFYIYTFISTRAFSFPYCCNIVSPCPTQIYCLLFYYFSFFSNPSLFSEKNKFFFLFSCIVSSLL